MKHWTIGKRVILGFSTLLVLVVALAVTNAILLRNINTRLKTVTDETLPGLKISAQTTLNTALSAIDLLRHLSAKTEDEKKALEDHSAAIAVDNQKLFAEYEKTLSSAEDKAAYEKCVQLRAEYIKARAHGFELSRAKKVEEADAFEKSTLRPAFNAYQAACIALLNSDAAQGDEASKQILRTVHQANILMVTVSTFAVVLGITFALVIAVGLKKVLHQVAVSLDDGSNQVASAAGQVSSASQSLAEGASEQAASLEETSSSLEEMSSMTQRNAENAQKANELAREARTAADAGASDMQAMNQAMHEIKAASDEIGKIIKTIDEIAFQTNILALNAAVEAARAGEAGMGFAVVADEVRNLAQRCAQSAKETADKIEGAITKTAQGVEISAKVTQGLQEIVAKVRQVDELVAEVATASKEQSQGISQVNTAVGQMDKVTQSNAANAEESASAAEELNAQAESLKEAVAQLMHLVGGQAATQAKGVALAERNFKAPQARTLQTKAPAPAQATSWLQSRSNSNGHGQTLPQPEPALAGVAARRTEELPLPGDFKDF